VSRPGVIRLGQPEVFGDIAVVDIGARASPDPLPSTIPPPSATRERRTRRASPWEVTNEFVHDGFSYRIQRRPLGGGVDVHLTAREEEALEHALLGLANKAIALRLGVTASTVGVLLFRAAAKFRVKTRAELLAAYTRCKSGPTEP